MRPSTPSIYLSALLLGVSLTLVSCLETNELDISSQKDYSPQGLSVGGENVPQGGMSKITVSVNYVTPRDVTFRLKTAGIEAVDGHDFQGINGDFTIPAGQKSISIPLTSFFRVQTPGDRRIAINVSDVVGASVLNSEKVITLQSEKYSTPIANAELLGSGRANCAKLADKRVYCWGDNKYGQVSGDATTSVSRGKTAIPNIDSDPIKLTSGAYSTCALYADGKVLCWGSNSNGETNRPGGAAPNATIAAGTLLTTAQQTAVDVAKGNVHTCVVFADGTAKCIGSGANGELGQGAATYSYSLVSVTGLSSAAKKIGTSAYSSCAILDTGGVSCWGLNTSGELGRGTVGGQVTTAGASLITSDALNITAGLYHYCVLKTGGTVQCWGNNTYGQVGFDSGGANVSTPYAVVLPRPAALVSAGWRSTCAVLDNGDAYCWGRNSFGQLGDGTFVDRAVPTKVVGLPDAVKSLSVGVDHVCANFVTEPRVLCWGDNAGASITGFGAAMTYATDISAIVGQKVKDITASGFQDFYSDNQQSACAVLDDGSTKCWGNNSSGQMGRAYAYADAPLGEATGLSAGFTRAISSGVQMVCALLVDTGLKCWGDNNYGQIGNGGVFTSYTWVDPGETPAGLSSGVSAIAGSGYHNCALMSDGTVKCFGSSSYGQAGTCASTNQTTPIAIAGLTDAVQIAANATTSCALTTDGTVKCWGSNAAGVFGTGVAGLSCLNTPTAAVTSLKFKKLALGGRHACAISADDSVYCWGKNLEGESGQPLLSVVYTPTLVQGLEKAAADVALGSAHSCALLKDGSVRCWGSDSYFQLGLNAKHSNTIYKPTAVVGAGTGIKAVKAYGSNTCAITVDGYAKCWGGNMGGLHVEGAARIPFPHEVYDERVSF